MIAVAVQLLSKLSSQFDLGGFKRKSPLCGCLYRLKNVLHLAAGLHEYCCITTWQHPPRQMPLARRGTGGADRSADAAAAIVRC